MSFTTFQISMWITRKGSSKNSPQKRFFYIFDDLLYEIGDIRHSLITHNLSEDEKWNECSECYVKSEKWYIRYQLRSKKFENHWIQHSIERYWKCGIFLDRSTVLLRLHFWKQEIRSQRLQPYQLLIQISGFLNDSWVRK